MPVPQQRAQSPADFSDCLALQKQLQAAVNALNGMTDSVSAARHVSHYDSDRRKRVLAIACLPFLTAGSSSSAAETEGRASQSYADAMQQLGKELKAAEKVLADWEAKKIQIEVARSLLALSRDTIKNL